MTLKQWASVLPGYVELCIHTADEAWTMSAGMVTAGGLPDNAYVITATPIAPYRVEVSIKFEEESE